MFKAFFVSLALLVGACTTAQLEQTFQSVDNLVRGGCNFAPAIETVITEINASIGATTGEIAASICTAVNTITVAPPSASARLRGTLLTARGTMVKGCWQAGPRAGQCI